jgi:hypothetical protein
VGFGILPQHGLSLPTTLLSKRQRTALPPLPLDLADLPQVYLVYPKWNGEKHNLYLNDTDGNESGLF